MVYKNISSKKKKRSSLDWILITAIHIIARLAETHCTHLLVDYNVRAVCWEYIEPAAYLFQCGS